jgi:hypothetical protein
MDRRIWCVAVLVVALAAGAEPERRFRHTGVVIDAITRQGVAARITAYSSKRLLDRGVCPTLEKEIDARVADVSGSVELNIPQSSTTFAATYCAEGYVSRIEEINDNRRDGTLLAPDPILLYPRTRGGELHTAANALAVLDAQLRDNVAQIREAEIAAFEKHVAGLDEAARQLIRALELPAADPPRFVSYHEFAAPHSLETLIAFARATLAYFLSSDPTMTKALSSYSHLKRFARAAAQPRRP